MNIAIILSGGTGTRLGGDIPKQYIEVNNKPVIGYCLETILSHEMIDMVYIVAAPEWQDFLSNAINTLSISDKAKAKFAGFALPGENRQYSIYNGLLCVKELFQAATIPGNSLLNKALNTSLSVKASDASLSEKASNTSLLDKCAGSSINREGLAANVFIHDAARPLLSESLISRCFEALDEHEGVLPVLPMKDTIYQSDDGKLVSALLDRKKLFAGQAPEAFVFDKYLEANEAYVPFKTINGSTEVAIMHQMDVAMIDGEEINFKITTRADLERFQQILNKA